MTLTGRKNSIIFDVSSASVETKNKIVHVHGRFFPFITLEIANTFVYRAQLDSLDWCMSHYKDIFAINPSDYYIMTYNDREWLGEIK